MLRQLGHEQRAGVLQTICLALATIQLCHCVCVCVCVCFGQIKYSTRSHRPNTGRETLRPPTGRAVEIVGGR